MHSENSRRVFGVGIIGAGSYGETHAEALAQLPNARLVAACRSNAGALAAFTVRFGGRGYTDYQELLADPEVEVVAIATPHHMHTEIAVAAARAGKAILLEKPMAPTLDECDRIIAAADRAGVALTVGLVSHFARQYRIAKEILGAGTLGEVALGVSTMSKFWYEPNRRAWHLDRASGGGMWLTGGLHCLDRLTWLVDSRVTEVYARFETRFHDQAADDLGLVSLRYANGALGTVVSTGYKVGANKFMTELTCTNGMLNVDDWTGVAVGREEQWRPVPDSGGSGWMVPAVADEWRGFLNAIECRTPPPISPDYARHIMAVAFAAEESSRTGQIVRINE